MTPATLSSVVSYLKTTSNHNVRLGQIDDFGLYLI